MKVTILVGTMTGTAQLVAQELELVWDDGETQVETLLMDKLDASVFQREGVFLVCTSTYGQGDIPDNSKALFADLSRQFGRLAAAREVLFQIDDDSSAGGAPLLVQADPTRLRQVLLALLDNALRHTPPGGSISLAARGDGPLALHAGGRFWDRSLPGARVPVAIVVSDSGEGIAAEDLPHVFERFYRAGASGGAGGEGGAGLGLALAKALVEAQGGRMAIESQRGLGTRVTIGLPVPA